MLPLGSVPQGQIPKGNISIGLAEVASGLTAPNYATHAGDGSNRLFVLDQVGQVRVIDSGGNLLPTPFLDLSSQIPTPNAFFDERGPLGLAFHPDYANNGRLFVRYSAPRAGVSTEPCNDPGGFVVGCHEEILAEVNVSATDPNQADPASQQILFRVGEPQFNHDGGQVGFGPDGLLYFSLGDGGGDHDGLADVPPSHGPTGNGQNIETTLGSILRINVDGPPDAGLAYSIPETNPFAGAATGADEIYAYGLRNPYRFSFDDGPGGDDRLILADVGQNRVEEIDIIVNGGNYGWVTKEGSDCFDPLNPTTPPASCSDTGAAGEPLIDPVAEYDHIEGIAIVGGYVYRGTESDILRGKYVFGDFSRQFTVPDGHFFYVDADGDLSQIFEFALGGADNPLNLFVLGIGRDEAGELYVLTQSTLGPTGTTGQVLRINVIPLPAAGWMGLGLLTVTAVAGAARRNRDRCRPAN